MSLEVLKNEIKLKKIGHLYLFYGTEEYLQKYYLELIKKIILDPDLQEMNTIFIEGKGTTGRLIDAFEALPFFSERKLVVVKDSGLFKTKKKNTTDGTEQHDLEADEFGEASKSGKGSRAAKSGDSIEFLAEYLKKVPKHVSIVFYEEEIDKRSKIHNTIAKHGLVVEFPYQKPEELVKWVIKVFKSSDCEISASAATKLVDGTDLRMNEILNEARKVIGFVGDRKKAELEDIDTVCSRSLKSRIFDLTDAIADKDSMKAFRHLNEMLLLKEPLQKIFFMITRQFRIVLEIKLLKTAGFGQDIAAKRLGLHPYAAGKAMKQSSGFTVDILKQAVQDCLAFDLAVKSGHMQDRIAVELLIAKYSKI